MAGPVSSTELHCLLSSLWGSDVAVWSVVPATLTPHYCVQFQASSWKSLILKVCRGAYPPLPNHLPYELQYLVKQMFKTNPRDRPSVHTILTSHRVSRLLRTQLPSQVNHSHPPRALKSAAHCGWASLHGDSHSSCWTWSHFMAAHPSQRRTLHDVVSRWGFKLFYNFPSCGESDLWQAAVSSDGRRAHGVRLIYCFTAESFTGDRDGRTREACGSVEQRRGNEGG